jgi:hypothetical protein
VAEGICQVTEAGDFIGMMGKNEINEKDKA